MEQALCDDYKKTRVEVKTIKRLWFIVEQSSFKEFYPYENFKASDQWCFEIYQPFRNFTSQKNALCTKRSTKFDLFNREVLFDGVAYQKMWNIPDERHRKHGSNTTAFVMDDRKMYADKGSSEVWCATHGSGLGKRQSSVCLTIFADRKPRVKPLVIFKV